MATVFNAEDVERYFDLIKLPAEYRTCKRDYLLLSMLHKYQIATIPYENLSIHYSQSHEVNIDPRAAFSKFCSGTGRGGYCMEVAIFYLHMLRAIGFEAYHTGVRIRLREDGVPTGNYIGLVHIINIVTLDNGEKFAVDVAFGGDGPTHPMKLVEDHVTNNLGPQVVRYVRESIPQFESDAKFWIYQYRNDRSQPWRSFYCFQEVPFLFEDFMIMNHYTSSIHPNQTSRVLVVLFLQAEDGLGIAGKLMLVDGTVKQNTGGKTKILYEATTEKERIQALQHFFRITLSDEESTSIHGRPTALVKKAEIGSW